MKQHHSLYDHLVAALLIGQLGLHHVASYSLILGVTLTVVQWGQSLSYFPPPALSPSLSRVIIPPHLSFLVLLTLFYLG